MKQSLIYEYMTSMDLTAYQSQNTMLIFYLITVQKLNMSTIKVTATSQIYAAITAYRLWWSYIQYFT